jgi:hypothetical protein
LPDIQHSITLPQRTDYLMQPRLGDQPDSLTQNINKMVYEDWKKHRRAPNSIHCSNYWHTCDFSFMAERRGIDPGWEDFNLSNKLAAEAGDYSHINFQKYLVECGMAIQIPSFHADEEQRNYERANGILMDAIEINLSDYYKPMETELYNKYSAGGFYLDDWATLYEELVNFYRFGVRLDSDIIKPGPYTDPMPCEIKSTKEKKYNDIVSWVERYLHWQRSGGKARGLKAPVVPDKVIDYNNQLQMQMRFMPNPYTGETPKWGTIYVVNRNDESQSIELFVKYNPNHVNYWLGRIRARKLLWDSMEEGTTTPTKDNCFFCVWNKGVCTDPNKFPRFGSWKQEFKSGTQDSPWREEESSSNFEFLVKAN